jgi:hypothetical protein
VVSCGRLTSFPSGALAILIALFSAGQLEAVQSRAAEYEVSAVSDGAALTGSVSFTGDVPEASELLITRDFEVCGLGFRERREVDVAEAGGLRSVVVFIANIAGGKPWPEAADGYLLDQRDCYFDPYIQVVPRGADLQIENSDPVLHNVHGYERIDSSRRRTLFNLGQPDKGIIVRPLRPRRGQQIGLECDAHDFMLGWIFATDSPYAVVVDSMGVFEIPDVPPGTYTIGAWHPFLGVMEQEVTVAAGAASEISFEFSAD